MSNRSYGRYEPAMGSGPVHSGSVDIWSADGVGGIEMNVPLGRSGAGVTGVQCEGQFDTRIGAESMGRRSISGHERFVSVKAK